MILHGIHGGRSHSGHTDIRYISGRNEVADRTVEGLVDVAGLGTKYNPRFIQRTDSGKKQVAHGNSLRVYRGRNRRVLRRHQNGEGELAGGCRIHDNRDVIAGGVMAGIKKTDAVGKVRILQTKRSCLVIHHRDKGCIRACHIPTEGHCGIGTGGENGAP